MRRLYREIGLVCALLVLGSACATVPKEPAFHLTILHNNDFHSRLLPINSIDQTCSDEEQKEKVCFGGIARRVHEVRRIREQKPNLLLLDAGDEFQGSLFYVKYKGDESRRFLNQMQYTAMAVGNHEFDDGPANLARFIKGADFPLLSANIDVSEEPVLKGLIHPYFVTLVGGQQVGIVGFTTEETAFISAPGHKIRFLPIEPAVQKAVDELKAQGIRHIIGLSHSGYSRDLEVAKQVRGLDVIVGGHTNTYLSNTDPKADGPYPTVITSPDGEPVLVVTAYAYGKLLGELDVDFDPEGRVLKWGGAPLLLDDSVPLDQKAAEEVALLEKPLDKLRHEVVGELQQPLLGGASPCRFEECSMGDALADAILDLTKSYGAQAAFTNGGGVRTGISKGPLTRWKVMDALPFGNQVTVFDLRGDKLWEAFEFGAGDLGDGQHDGSAKLLQVSGFRYALNQDRPVGSRLTSLEIQIKGKWVPVRKDVTYRVASNQFLTGGGDGFELLRLNIQNVFDLSETLDETFVRYVASGRHRGAVYGKRIRIEGRSSSEKSM